ncbi:MAG TPA: hypothetical protein VEY71_10580 [Chitinophagales bacterium]|nr:hypothetical protein [Chitinophagales bacterium]
MQAEQVTTRGNPVHFCFYALVGGELVREYKQQPAVGCVPLHQRVKVKNAGFEMIGEIVDQNDRSVTTFRHFVNLVHHLVVRVSAEAG